MCTASQSFYVTGSSFIHACGGGGNIIRKALHNVLWSIMNL